jgi:HSP20 family molecular chaperone IbpA
VSYRELNVDVCETSEGLRIWADLPGVDEKSVDVHLERDVLTIEGRPAGDLARAGAAHVEYEVGTFRRKFRLSDEIDSEGIEARMSDGVLELKLPKVARARPRRIEVS